VKLGASPAAGFVQIPLAAAGGRQWVELVLPDGTLVRVPAHRTTALTTILRVLRSEDSADRGAAAASGGFGTGVAPICWSCSRIAGRLRIPSPCGKSGLRKSSVFRTPRGFAGCVPASRHVRRRRPTGNRSWFGWSPGNSGSAALGGIDSRGALRVRLWPRRNALFRECPFPETA
jgi:hypothetical protein